MTMILESASFHHMGMISLRQTCDGLDLSPHLTWKGIPDNTQSLALIIDDPDAPDPAAPKQTWVHWVLYNLPPSVHELPEGIDPTHLPTVALQGMNDWHQTSYGGPCPPMGLHRYFHKLFALDLRLPELEPPTKKMLLLAMQGHILAYTELIGLYQRTH